MRHMRMTNAMLSHMAKHLVNLSLSAETKPIFLHNIRLCKLSWKQILKVTILDYLIVMNEIIYFANVSPDIFTVNIFICQATTCDTG